ncbi:hypothetical protein [Tahibacter amnicola]|uniref:Lipoprotein n=1 Tax=Tahibacter amnicola TaxID=2976241 RepID=A0ABY6B989_9GAMM|nr:hypothetical protein [Tahibacter amnicola]UXI66574.1 hypothetical protein N4264_17700 [Tahibacter amnicola]
MKRLSVVALLACSFALTACATTSHVTSRQPGAELSLRNHQVALPSSHRLRVTSFGNYAFKVVAADGEPFYGVLPLAFKGGHLAADILLFAPAAFFNVRGAYKYYEFDTGKGIVRFRDHPSDPWTEYAPKPEEVARARGYFASRAFGK